MLKDSLRVRNSWSRTFGGSANSHKVAVLEEEMKYIPISISQNEVQFLETRKFQIDEIARIFRVPCHMVGDFEKSGFSNIEQQSLEFQGRRRIWLVFCYCRKKRKHNLSSLM